MNVQEAVEILKILTPDQLALHDAIKEEQKNKK